MASYKEYNDLVQQAGKYFNKPYTHSRLTLEELKHISSITHRMKATRQQLLQKAIEKQLAKQQAVVEHKNNNLMTQLSTGE
jgi:hypothetical protein